MTLALKKLRGGGGVGREGKMESHKFTPFYKEQGNLYTHILQYCKYSKLCHSYKVSDMNTLVDS